MHKCLKHATVWLVLTFFLCPSPQADDAAEFGFQVGGGYAQLDGNPNFDDSKFRLRFGVFASARLDNNLSYQVELNYVRKGGYGEIVTVTYLGDSTWWDLEAQLDYVEIPVLLKAQLAPKSEIRPFISGGVYLAWVLEKHYSGAEYQPANSDWGLTYGGGFQPVIHGRTFIIEVRYTNGLKKIIDDPRDYRLKNQTLSFTLGVGL